MPGDHHGNSSACHMVIACEERMFCIRSEGDCCLMFAILISVGEEDMRSLGWEISIVDGLFLDDLVIFKRRRFCF